MLKYNKMEDVLKKAAKPKEKKKVLVKKIPLEKVTLLKDYPPKKAGETIKVSKEGKQLLIKSKHI